MTEDRGASFACFILYWQRHSYCLALMVGHSHAAWTALNKTGVATEHKADALWKNEEVLTKTR